MLIEHEVLPVKTMVRRRKATYIISAPVSVCVRAASCRVCVPAVRLDPLCDAVL